jgi:hypothetical protein
VKKFESLIHNEPTVVTKVLLNSESHLLLLSMTTLTTLPQFNCMSFYFTFLKS